MTTSNETAVAASATKKAKSKKSAKKTTAKKAKGKKTNGNSKGRSPQFGDDKRIKLLVKENPRRAGTDAHSKFALIKDGITVGDVVKKGKAKGFDMRGHLAACIAKGQISIK